LPVPQGTADHPRPNLTQRAREGSFRIPSSGQRTWKGVWEQEKKAKTLVVERANFDDDYGVIREALRLDVERVTAG
jgi:hypothetical protein